MKTLQYNAKISFRENYLDKIRSLRENYIENRVENSLNIFLHKQILIRQILTLYSQIRFDIMRYSNLFIR